MIWTPIQTETLADGSFDFTDWFRTLEFVVPFTWLMAGRMEFILGAFVCTLVVTTPLSRLPKQRDRMAIGFLMTAGCLQPLPRRRDGVNVWPP